MVDSSRFFFGRPVDIVNLLANPAPALDFVLPGLTAGTVGTLIGPGGMGKTMFELELAILLATGLLRRDPLFGTDACDGLSTAPQKVILLAAEEPLPVLWQRVHDIVQSLNQRDVLPEGLGWPEFLARLQANLLLFPMGGAKRVNLLTEELLPSEAALALGRLSQGARLLIVDPLRQLHLEDENQSAPMSALMSVFKQVAQDSGAAVMVAHHSSRAAGLQGYGDTADAGRGSTALKDDARWQINLQPPKRDMLDEYGIAANQKDAHVVLIDAKNNYGPKRDPVMLKRTARGVLVPVEPPTLRASVKASVKAPAKRSTRPHSAPRREEGEQYECF
jgi:regulatory protein RepA